jgi:Trk K+ transport system NAD-binding subunit
MALLLSLEGALEFPAAFDLLTRMRGVRVREAELRNPALAGQTLQELHLPGGALVMGVRRAGEVLVPKGDTRLQMGDVLMLVASDEEFDKVHVWLEES